MNKKRKMYEENCVYDFNEGICREFAENEDLHDELYRGEEQDDE